MHRTPREAAEAERLCQRLALLLEIDAAEDARVDAIQHAMEHGIAADPIPIRRRLAAARAALAAFDAQHPATAGGR